MNAAASILSLTATDASHVAIVLDGNPSGAWSVQASQSALTAAVDRLTLAYTGAGTTGSPAVVTVPTAGMWWFWIVDQRGTSRAPAFIRMGQDQEILLETQRWLVDLLSAHKAALDAALVGLAVPGASTVPNQPAVPRVAQIVGGMAALANEYPAVVVDDPDLDEPYVALEYVRQVQVGALVAVYYVHRDKRGALLPAATALGRRIQMILNQREHERVILPSGVILANCRADDMRVQEEAYEDVGGFVASASMRWTGETTRGC